MQADANIEAAYRMTTALLTEALYALQYAADMTKPEDMSGCSCPICTVIPKIEVALVEQPVIAPDREAEIESIFYLIELAEDSVTNRDSYHVRLKARNDYKSAIRKLARGAEK